jgi:hypothetical protein
MVKRDAVQHRSLARSSGLSLAYLSAPPATVMSLNYLSLRVTCRKAVGTAQLYANLC